MFKSILVPIDLADTVVSPGFLDEVLPDLAAEPLGAPLWFEVRPEMSRAQVRAAAAAMGAVQIGVESLSDHVLGLMGKGTRALECLRLLKWCREAGLPSGWNIIYDIPGEADDDYAEMTRLLPSLWSLPAPAAFRPMYLDRFSAYLDHASRYGLEDVRPAEAYGLIYPLPEPDLREIAYTFRFRRDRSLLRSARIRRLFDEVAAWKDQAGTVGLRLSGGTAGTTAIVATEPDARDRTIVLDELDAALYEACSDIAGRDELLSLARSCLGERAGSLEDVEALLDARLERFVAERLMVAIGGRYLSLALAAEPEAAPAS